MKVLDVIKANLSNNLFIIALVAGIILLSSCCPSSGYSNPYEVQNFSAGQLEVAELADH